MTDTKDETEPEQEEGPRSFAHFLTQMADGEANAALSVDLVKLIKACRSEALAQHDKVKGKLVLTLNFECDPAGFVTTAYEIKRAEPHPKRSGSIFWITGAGNLTVENPRQTSLDLRDVSDPTGDTRDVPAKQTIDSETGEVTT